MNREPRRLVLCFDSTANHFGEKVVTNVVRLESILKDEEAEQLCYYEVRFLYISNTLALAPL